MKNLLTVREYERIFTEDCPCFNELVKFAEEFKFPEEFKSDKADDVLKFIELGFERRGAFVQAKNYVGVIRLPSGFQIEILPKLDAPHDDLRGLLVKMLSTLKDFAGKKFLNAELLTEQMPLYEVFIRAYLERVAELVKRGLKSSYVVREENLNFFKGKLLVAENLRRNFAHREKFFVAFDEYSIDRPEHRLIKATLFKLLHSTRDNKNFRLASRLLGDFDSVAASNNYRKDFATVSIDRTNREYQAVMNWTRIFFSGKSFTTAAGKAEALALLFDMNKLFEAYVAEHVRKFFSDKFTVKIQAREKYLFDAPRRFKLKPDIILERDDEKFILDTKWKFEISPSDMYQMFAYAKKYCAKKIFLLCPPNVAESFYRAEDFQVQIVGVDLFNMLNLRGLQIDGRKNFLLAE